MGVDIYGIAPVLVGVKPEHPENYSELSDDQREEHWKAVHEWEEKNPGFYFRNNWWHWRPLQYLIGIYNSRDEIGIPNEEIAALGHNDGIGVSKPEHCLALAEHFDRTIADMKLLKIDKIYMSTAMWSRQVVDENGNVTHEYVKDESILKRLNDKYAGVFFDTPEIDGINYYPSHSTVLENLEEFSEFLKNCNGFQVF